ncbi:MAG: lysophospholipid acyltransferase family protein [Bdellovibrionota bacterium]
MKQFWTILTYAFLIGGSAVCGAAAFLVAILGDRQGRLWWPIAQFWARNLLRVGRVSHLHIVGGERLENLSGAIVMSNHESHFDPPSLMAASPTPLRFLTKHSLFYFPIFGQALWAMGYISINRGVQAKAFKSIEKAAQAIRGGRTVLIFPEGTRAMTSELLPFKKGGFVIAAKSQVPIVPVGIAGTREVIPKGFHWLLRSPVVLVVGAPIETKGFDLDNKEALMEKVRTEIARLREEARALRENVLRGEALPGGKALW